MPSAFWATYVFTEAARRGHGALVVDCIRRRWRAMGDAGSTWEDFTWNEEGGSASHAWTAHPAYHLPELLCGITQLAPGWRSVRLAPTTAAGVAHASATVPTPLGDLVVAVEPDGLRVTVPAGMDVAVADGRRLGAGEHALMYDPNRFQTGAKESPET